MNLSHLSPVWDASGLRGIAGEGYWFHRYLPGILSFKGSLLVTKTTTSFRQQGNMPLDENYQPRDRFPACIWTDPVRGLTLNSVALSGPGVAYTATWYSLVPEPFLISWMPIGTSLDEQIAEAQEFVYHIGRQRRVFVCNEFGIQFNVSCPNVGADLTALLEKTDMLLSILAELEVPIVVKLNLLVTPEAALKIAKHPACAGICIANSVPFGTVLPDSFWESTFPYGSPLEARNPDFKKGGLSGPPLFPHVRDWVSRFRRSDQETHVNAGGGVWHASHVDQLYAAGASSIFIGTVAMHRPWRVRGIIRRAHKVFGR